VVGPESRAASGCGGIPCAKRKRCASKPLQHFYKEQFEDILLQLSTEDLFWALYLSSLFAGSLKWLVFLKTPVP